LEQAYSPNSHASSHFGISTALSFRVRLIEEINCEIRSRRWREIVSVVHTYNDSWIEANKVVYDYMKEGIRNPDGAHEIISSLRMGMPPGHMKKRAKGENAAQAATVDNGGRQAQGK
jgi:hypothetical protein